MTDKDLETIVSAHMVLMVHAHIGSTVHMASFFDTKSYQSLVTVCGLALIGMDAVIAVTGLLRETVDCLMCLAET